MSNTNFRPDLVIFDVDGTLYNARNLRNKMLFSLIRYYFFHPGKFSELKVIQTFRKEREKLSDTEASDILTQQYEIPAGICGKSPAEVEKIITHWMHRQPLRHLPSVTYPSARKVLSYLKEQNITTVAYSDFPAKEKIATMGLQFDKIFSAHDPEINRLKPHAAGLNHILTTLQVPAERCLMVGDREDRDGEAARRTGMPFFQIQTNGEESMRQLLAQLSGNND